MIYGFFLISVVSLGIIGYIGISVSETSCKDACVVPIEYEIIEDND
jgi:hypothetical protein